MKKIRTISKTLFAPFKRLKNQTGQTATEYMLIIAVVVLGAVAGASILIPQFKQAVWDLADDVKSIMSNSAEDAQGEIENNTAQFQGQ